MHLGPEGVVRLAVPAVAVPAAAERAATGGGAGRQDVVAVFLDGLGGEQVVELLGVLCFSRPATNGLEHFALDLDVVVADGRVVEGAEDVVDDFVDGHAGVFPGVDDAARWGVSTEVCRVGDTVSRVGLTGQRISGWLRRFGRRTN